MTDIAPRRCQICDGPAPVEKHPTARGFLVAACPDDGWRSLPFKPPKQLRRRRRHHRGATPRPGPAAASPSRPAGTWGQDTYWRDPDEREAAFWGEGAA